MRAAVVAALCAFVLIALIDCGGERPKLAAKLDSFTPKRAYVERPYDLASDVAGRIDEVRSRFGPNARVKVEGAAFVIVDADHGPLFAPGADLVRRVIRSFLAGPFRAAPDRAITVDLFSSHAAYVAYSKARYGIDPEPHSLLGYYRKATREMLVDGASGWGTLVHELTHAFIEHDWEGSSAGVPAWISEGIASLFEAYSFAPDGSIHGVTNWRLQVLRRSVDVRASTLFDTTDEDFEQGDALTQSRWYALARFACQWLDSDDAGRKLWAFYALFRDTYDSDPTGRTAFSRSVGWSPSKADRRFAEYLRRLRAPR